MDASKGDDERQGRRLGFWGLVAGALNPAEAMKTDLEMGDRKNAFSYKPILDAGGGSLPSSPLKQLRWLGVWAPMAFVLLLLLFEEAASQILPPWLVHLLVLSLVGVGAFVFAQIERREAMILRQTRKLEGLIQGNLTITSTLRLDELLQQIVEGAAQLTDARYGALGVLDETGEIDRFHVTGVDAETFAKIDQPPESMTLLGELLREGKVL